jgi:hypothetical protein
MIGNFVVVQFHGITNVSAAGIISVAMCVSALTFEILEVYFSRRGELWNSRPRSPRHSGLALIN